MTMYPCIVLLFVDAFCYFVLVLTADSLRMFARLMPIAVRVFAVESKQSDWHDSDAMAKELRNFLLLPVPKKVSGLPSLILMVFMLYIIYSTSNITIFFLNFKVHQSIKYLYVHTHIWTYFRQTPMDTCVVLSSLIGTWKNLKWLYVNLCYFSVM